MIDILHEDEEYLSSKLQIDQFFGQFIMDTEWRVGDQNGPWYRVRKYKTNFESHYGTIITISYDDLKNEFCIMERSKNDYYSQLF